MGNDDIGERKDSFVLLDILTQINRRHRRVKIALVLLLLFTLAWGVYERIDAGAWGARMVRVDHGWKTEYVIATRYKNEGFIGYNIGFEFPKNPYDCDRADIFEFFELHGGFPFQGGGSPGAAIYVKFRGVTDRASADKKLQEILPALDRLMSDITAGRMAR